MSAWKKNKVDSSLINKGQEYAKGDNVPLDQLNAITNNSFYAVDKADEALEKANSAFENNGTVVKVANSVVTNLSFDSDPQTQINSKASQSDLDSANSNITTNSNNITSLDKNKADTNALNLTESDAKSWIGKLGVGNDYSLWVGSIGGLPTVTLNESMMNYPYLWVYIVQSDTYRWGQIIPTSWFKGNCTSSESRFVMATDAVFCAFYYVSDTQIKIDSKSDGSGWAVIQGIKG